MSNFHQPEQTIKDKLLRAIEYGEKMALNTFYDDKDLHDCLFALGNTYRRVLDGEDIKILEVQKLLDRFYAIDPEFIKMIDDAQSTTS